MDIVDLLAAVGGTKSLAAIAEKLDIRGYEANRIAKALAPIFTRALQQQADTVRSQLSLRRALASGNHQKYIDDPATMGLDHTRIEGNKILGYLLGGKSVSRNIATHVAAIANVDAGTVKHALPLIASAVMAAVSKVSNSGRDLLKPIDGASAVLCDLLLGDSADQEVDELLGLPRGAA